MVYAMRTNNIITTKKDIFKKKPLPEDVKKRREYLSSIDISISNDLNADIIVVRKK